MKRKRERNHRILIPAAFLIIGISTLFAPVNAFAQGHLISPGEETLPALDEELKAAIIDSVAAACTEIYVFPEVAKKMVKFARKQFRRGQYRNIGSLPEFASALTRDLRETCNDNHVTIYPVTSKEIEELQKEDEPDAVLPVRLRMLEKNNFHFRKIEILPGNVGYLRLDMFPDASMSSATAVAAMNFLAHCDAIIFDLRHNGGGSPSLIQLLTSYFLEEPTHLNSFYIRKEDEMRQFWSAAHVEGPRLTGVDLYVLTSRRTFSGAEEFTYNLKNLERATIIGETTGGDAHPVEGRLFETLHIQAIVPFGRAINPVTGTNWEGTGVTLHIEVPADDALETAHLEAMKKLRDRDDLTDEEEFLLDWAVAGLEASLKPVKVDESVLKSYAGHYEERVLTFEDGKLLYQRGDHPRMQALPKG